MSRSFAVYHIKQIASFLHITPTHLSQQFTVGVSARAELTMPIFAVNVGIGYNLFQNGPDTKGLYQVLALKTFLIPRIFLHTGYMLKDFNKPKNLMLGIGYRF